MAAGTLEEMIERAESVTRALALLLIGAILTCRALAPTVWPVCRVCERTLRSKGFAPREIQTRFGVVRWRRRLGRCPSGCTIGQFAPLDTALGLAGGQRTSMELQRSASLLAVFVPLETAAAILRRMQGVKVCGSGIWNWVQAAGARAEANLQGELAKLEATGAVAIEQIEAHIAKLVLLIGADGVMVPFRPTPGSPKGTAVWREVKLAVLARLDQRLRPNGVAQVKLARRRLVAVLGDIDALAVRLKLEALRQGITVAPCVVWISDGARGLWRLFHDYLAPLGALGILDFYHAVGQLWSAAETWYHLYLPSGREWLARARRQLRHGEVDSVITQLQEAADDAHRSPDHRKIIQRVTDYLTTHRDHLRYPVFKQRDLPIGSGFVESACKWLIQQRFKGVGMRWSEDGFNNLLLLRLAWANDRFDQLFSPSPMGASTR